MNPLPSEEEGCYPMKKAIKVITSLLALLLIDSLPAAPLAGTALAAAYASDVTVNRSDSLSRLFTDKPEYCLYCGEVHTGSGGRFKQFFHDAAYFFCGIVGRYPGEGRMYFTADTLDVGADEPFYFIHIGDTHVSYIDERDCGDARLVETAGKRADYCPKDLRMLDDVALKARELDAFIVNTGDLIDFVSRKNLDIAREFNTKNDVFTSAGNHEYHVYIWNDGDNYERRDRVRDTVKAAYTNDIEFSVRIEHGVKFIAMDNAFHNIDARQLERFKEELAKDDLPIILALHVPVYAPDIFAFQMEKLDYDHPAWLMGVPEELMREYRYSETDYAEQKANESTKEFCDLIRTSSEIKAIVTGHDHAHFVSQVTPTLRQYMVDCTEGQIFEVR